jgi:hypothetical protein
MKFVDEGPRLRRSTRKANVWIPGRRPINSLNSVSLVSAAGGDLAANSKPDNDNSGVVFCVCPVPDWSRLSSEVLLRELALACATALKLQ